MSCFVQNLTYAQTKWVLSEPEGSEISDTTIAANRELYRSLIIANFPQLTPEGSAKIGGPGMKVQVDEAQIGRRKYNVGRMCEHSWVIGLVDSHGERRMEVIPGNCRNRTTLHGIIVRLCAPGSIIVTDGWAAYRGIGKKGGFVGHMVVNHKDHFVDPGTGAHTQRAESMWRQLRRLFTPGGRRKWLIKDYLVEHL